MGKQEEIKENVKINTIENLITAGIDTIVPITVSYLDEEYAVDIKPLSTNQMNQINVHFMRSNQTANMSLQICLKGMIKSDGTNYKEEELLRLPSGVVDVIAKEIGIVSGTVRENDPEQQKLIREMLGF